MVIKIHVDGMWKRYFLYRRWLLHSPIPLYEKKQPFYYCLYLKNNQIKYIWINQNKNFNICETVRKSNTTNTINKRNT